MIHVIMHSKTETIHTCTCIQIIWYKIYWKRRVKSTCSFHSSSYSSLLTLSQTTNFRLFQTERVCRRQFKIRQKWRKIIPSGRKHCGKRRNCSLRAISPFPTVFSKGLFPRGVKRCHCVGTG